MHPVPLTNNHTTRYTVTFWVKILTVILALILAFNVFLLVRVPEFLKGTFYGIFREVARTQMLLRTWQWDQLEDDLFIVRYQGDVASARLVLDTAQQSYPRICNDLNYRPTKKIPIIVYESRRQLNASFGWPASENAMGVYWGGVIRVLAPTVWISDQEPAIIERVFQQAGPMAHEMTHLALDYIARGNYPRWFTEGLAQYQEFKMTGFVLDWSVEDENPQWYQLTQMDRGFDALPDQNLAYRQSLAAIEYIVAEYGEVGLNNIIKGLAQGYNFNEALEQAIGLNVETLADVWQQQLVQ